MLKRLENIEKITTSPEESEEVSNVLILQLGPPQLLPCQHLSVVHAFSPPTLTHSLTHSLTHMQPLLVT